MHRVVLLLLLALAACGGPAPGGHGIAARLECAPFARALSGIDIQGNAADWWWKAEGRYDRGTRPETGSVLVFSSSSLLPLGHVAVVSKVVSRDEVLVTQANWMRHRVTTDQLVRDVSPSGDWSRVRIWWPPSKTLGNSVYPVLGFIYSGRSVSHDRLVRAVPGAIRVASGE